MSQPFLRIPPFPGHRASPLATPIVNCGTAFSNADVGELARNLKAARVGGTFWGEQPAVSSPLPLVLAPDSPRQLDIMLAEAERHELAANAVICAPASWLPNKVYKHFSPNSDPWWIARNAETIWAGSDNELALVAALQQRPLKLFGSGRFDDCTTDTVASLANELARWTYSDPFTGRKIAANEAVPILALWRRIIDSNRPIQAVFGVASWKRVTVDPLLWAGTKPVLHQRSVSSQLTSQSLVVAWKSRTSQRTLSSLANSGVQIGEIEDGMIRSSGLGANCVPPLSVIIDISGIYFDPSRSSDLEHILQNEEIKSSLILRASALRDALIQNSISKYEQGSPRPEGYRQQARRVLVTGQVEDDRSILVGGLGTTNIELLRRARSLEPDAWIVYKPHPDVEAGHRKGYVSDADALLYANEIHRDGAITGLIESVDALHVITSLAGFEALLRGKQVITHGIPFYAGWGLTIDLAATPPRRTRRLSLDELVAATLLIYPRYLDPVTRLPCPAEILVERLAAGEGKLRSLLITLREWQGRAKMAWRNLRGLA